jgi:hypothetical protein
LISWLRDSVRIVIRTRFRKIFDARALGDPRIVEVLGLDEAQRRRLDEAIRAVKAEEQKMVDVMKRSRFPTAEARHRFVEKYRQAANARLMAVLNDKQKAHLEALKGKPFPAVAQLRQHVGSISRLLP